MDDTNGLNQTRFPSSDVTLECFKCQQADRERERQRFNSGDTLNKLTKNNWLKENREVERKIEGNIRNNSERHRVSIFHKVCKQGARRCHLCSSKVNLCLMFTELWKPQRLGLHFKDKTLRVYRQLRSPQEKQQPWPKQLHPASAQLSAV